MRIELASVAGFVVSQSHDVYTEKNLFRERVKGSGIYLSLRVSLSHRSCNPHLILLRVVLV